MIGKDYKIITEVNEDKIYITLMWYESEMEEKVTKELVRADKTYSDEKGWVTANISAIFEYVQQLNSIFKEDSKMSSKPI